MWYIRYITPKGEIYLFASQLGSFAEDVYATMCGNMREEYKTQGVEDAFAEGMDCDRWYAEVYDAKCRLCERLGEEDEDVDVERIIGNLLAIQHELCIKMYEYGAKFSIRE